MDRLFEKTFSGRTNGGSTNGKNMPKWALSLDVIETDDEYVVKASLPGISPDDLDVSYTDGVLTITGERIVEDEDLEDGRYLLRERLEGHFTRSIRLRKEIDADKIEANFVDGVLSLHLPMIEEVKPKRIEVKSGTSRMIEG
jgi:HSP20 family protein